MQLTADDFKRLSYEVRQFLAKGNLLTRLATTAQLYLEFPDVGSMHDAHRSILQVMDMSMVGPRERHMFERYIDDHTVAIEPYAGVSIILTCKQRFAIPMRGSVGYRDIAFKSVEE